MTDELSKEEMIIYIEEGLERLRDAELDEESFGILTEIYDGMAEIMDILDEQEGDGDEDEDG